VQSNDAVLLSYSAAQYHTLQNSTVQCCLPGTNLGGVEDEVVKAGSPAELQYSTVQYIQ